MKKINDWVIRTFGLRGSWSRAKKQMLNGAIIKRKATIGTYKITVDNDKNQLLVATWDHLDQSPVWERCPHSLLDEDAVDYFVTAHEERDNYEFEECLEIHGFVRGCSSAVMILRPANDHGEDFNYAKSVYYQVFLTDSKKVIQNMMHGTIYGKWTFVKRGENFGIKLVDVLPGIHKSIMQIAEREIFRS